MTASRASPLSSVLLLHQKQRCGVVICSYSPLYPLWWVWSVLVTSFCLSAAIHLPAFSSGVLLSSAQNLSLVAYLHKHSRTKSSGVLF